MQINSFSTRKFRRIFRFQIAWRILEHKFFQNLFKLYSKQGSIVIEVIHDLKVEYEYDSAIGKSLFFKGDFEEQEIHFSLERSLDAKDPIILDIGANIGWHSLKWAQKRQDATIFAFEPSPITREFLQRNIDANHFGERIHAIPYAVSDKFGFAKFFHCQDNAYSSLKDTKRKHVSGCLEVPVTTVDEFIASKSLDRVTLIKIDVEGFEKEVLIGSIKTLKKMKPDLFMEIYSGEASNSDPNGTVQLLIDMGYSAFVLQNGLPVKYTKHSDQHYNYYFTFSGKHNLKIA